MKAARALIQRAVAAAASLTGKRFGMLVASSLVATSGIVAAALSNPAGNGLLAAALGRSLSSPVAPVSAPVAAPSGGSSSSGGGQAATAAPLPAPAPLPASPSAVPVPEPAPEEPPAKEPAPPSLPEAGRIKHVFVISLASPGYEAAFGAASQMPYLSGTLRPQGQLLSGYTLLDEGALANSVAAVSGQPPNPQTAADCPTYAEFPPGAKADARGLQRGAGCVYPVETLSLADQLTSGRFSWRGYMEGMVDEAGRPDTCAHPGSGEADLPVPGGYATSQNPFAYFHSLLDLGDCAINDVSLDRLSADLGNAEKTASYSFIAPTPCDAGAAGRCAPGTPEGPANADAFLATWVPKILASPAYKADGLLVVAFNSVTAPGAEAAAAAAANPLQVGALLVSPFVPKGATDSGAYTPYALLRTSEELFGLQPLAMAASSKTATLAPALLGETGGD
jgi:phosphatidylinositol-3-phosphatase